MMLTRRTKKLFFTVKIIYMKKQFFFMLSCWALTAFTAFSQNIYKGYVDGEIYIKIKKEVSFKFDTLQKDINIKAKLPFLLPLVNKYNIIKVESPFYFSKSDTLKK